MLKLFFLGPPRFELDDTPIDIQRRKALALLIYLALSEKPVSRDALATLFYPDNSQQRARAYLRRDLAVLNTSLGGDWLQADRENAKLRQDEGLWSDVGRFRQLASTVRSHHQSPNAACSDCLDILREAATLYTDDFLAGFSLRDCPEFDEWQFFQAESLRQELDSVLGWLVQGLSEQGGYETAIPYARRRLSLDSLHEPAHRALMQLYAWSGQQAAALRQYEECVRLLDEEFGIAPEDETVALYEAIRTKRVAPPEVPVSPGPLRTELKPRERYLVEELLATGGQGEVYRGQDRLTGQQVVIKRLRPDFVTKDAGAVARFRRESEALSQLNHPNIVRMLATFEYQDQQQIVMEYVPGGSLRTRIEAKGRLTASEVLDIALELADALGRAHHRHIIHRDIKPSNVLIAADGTPRLTDFGLARLEREEVRITQSGAMLGSPAYMSPESLRGGEPDPRNDIWSFGVLLFEMLTGSRPFEGQHITRVMANILEKPVPDIRQIQPDVPAALADLVHRLLIKDPELRPGSMRQVAAELEAIRSGKEIGPRPPLEQLSPGPRPLPTRPFAPADQQIRFATSADSTRIGYAIVGSGPPLVKVANPLTHLQYDWESPVWRHWIEELSRHHMLVRYDERGCGMSERKVTTFSVEAWVDDLEAVVDDLGLEQFPIIGMSQGASIAVAYAARHPDKVSRLILYGGYARGRLKRELTPEKRMETEALLNLIRVGWGKDVPTFRQNFATLFMPDGLPHQHEWFNELARLTVDPEIAEIMERAFYNIDVTKLAPQITAPTLVLHPRGDAMVPFAEGQLLAELIPDAEFVPLESNNHLLLLDEPAWKQFLTEVQRFIPPAWTSIPAAARPVRAKGAAAPAELRPIQPRGALPRSKDDQGGDVTHQIPFIGREQEYGQLVSALDLALRTPGQVVLIEGESGIGKSRLVEEAAHFAQERGVKILSGKCYEAEQSMPYQLVIHLLAQILDQWPPELLRRLSPAYLAELARLVPEINNLFPNLPPPSDLKEAQQSQFFRALAHLLSTLAEGTGLMIVVDDVQWADRISQQFLNYLILHPEADPLLLVANYRSEEVATDRELSNLVQRWRREPQVSHLQLDRFTPADATALVKEYLEGSPQAATLGQWLYEETDGHPFFLVSILQSMAEQGLLSQTDGAGWRFETEIPTQHRLDVMLPDALQQSVNSRLRHLSKETKQVVDLAAVCGRRFDFQMLQAITKRDQDELLEILEDLLARQLWREVEAGRYFDFSHDKIREVVYHNLSNIKRVVLHRQVAEAIERQSSGRRVGLLAEQYEKGEVWDKAVSYLSQAADKATKLFAMGEAIDFYDRVIKIIEDNPDLADRHTCLRLYERRGEARTLAGQLADGITDLEEVLRAVRQTDDQAWQRTLLVDLGHACRKADRLEQALQYLTEALDLARQEGDDLAVTDILYHLGTTSFSAGDYYESAKYHQEAVDICTRLGNVDLAAVQAFHGRGEAYFTTGDATAAIEYYEKSLRLARQIQDKSFEAENLQMMGYACFGMSGIADYERGLSAFSESLAISQRLGLDWLNWASFVGWAYGLGCTGDYAQGLEKMEQHIEKLERVGIAPRYLSMTYDLYGDLLRDLNLLQEAEAARTRGLEVAAEVQVHFWYPRLKANLAIDRVRQGQLDVESDLLEALTSIGISGAVYHEVRCLEGLAEYYLAAGNPREALEHGEYLLAAATPGDHRELIAQAHRWRGEALLAMEDYAAAETALQQALSLAQVIRRPRLAWDIHDALARLFRQAGNTPAAEKHEARVTEIVAALAQNLQDKKWRAGLPL